MPLGVGLVDLVSGDLVRGFRQPRLSLDELIAYAWSLTTSYGDPVAAYALFGSVLVPYLRTELYAVPWTVWRTAGDDRVDDICRPFEGRTWEQGSEDALPPLHFGCRCEVVFSHVEWRSRQVLDVAWYDVDALAAALGGWF